MDAGGKLQKKRTNINPPKPPDKQQQLQSEASPKRSSVAVRRSKVSPMPTVLEKSKAEDTGDQSQWALDEAVTDLNVIRASPQAALQQNSHQTNYLRRPSDESQSPTAAVAAALSIPGAYVLPTNGTVSGPPIIIIPQQQAQTVNTLLGAQSPPIKKSQRPHVAAVWAQNGNVVNPTAASMGLESPVQIHRKRTTSNASSQLMEYKPLYRPKLPRRLEDLKRITTILIVLVSFLAGLDIFVSLWWLQDAIHQYLPSFSTQWFGPSTMQSLKVTNMLHGGKCAVETTSRTLDGVVITLNQFTSEPSCPHQSCLIDNQCRLANSFVPLDYGIVEQQPPLNNQTGLLFEPELKRNPPTNCSRMDSDFMAIHCEYTALYDSQVEFHACLLVNISSWFKWPYSSQQELQQLIAWNAKFAGSWPYLTYCKVRYFSTNNYIPLIRENQRTWLFPTLAYPPAAIGLVMAATAATCLFHTLKIIAIILGWCTKRTRSPSVVVWTSNSPVWLLLGFSDYYRTLVTMSFQKIGLRFQIFMDLFFAILPHSISALFLYFTVDKVPQTALFKAITSAAVLLMDFTVIIISASVLNIENRRLWNQEQIDNEYFVYRCLKKESQ